MRRDSLTDAPSVSRGLARSPPQFLVHAVLRCHCAIEFGVFSPASRDVLQIALPNVGLRQANAAGQGLNGYFVEAFAPLARRPAKSRIQRVRYVADGILHALIVGNAGI